MIKHAIKYKDYDGNEVEKEFWFNLDAGEIALVELSTKQGYSELLRVAQENDDPTVVGPAFEKIVLGAVGRRQGDQFIKDEDAINSLRWSGAYSALIIWMLQNPIESGEFINGMLPAEAQEDLKNSKDELVVKMKAKIDAMQVSTGQVKELSLDTEPSVFPVEPPQIVEMPAPGSPIPDDVMENVEAAARPLAADFAAMSDEEFQAWKATQV